MGAGCGSSSASLSNVGAPPPALSSNSLEPPPSIARPSDSPTISTLTEEGDSVGSPDESGSDSSWDSEEEGEDDVPHCAGFEDRLESYSLDDTSPLYLAVISDNEILLLDALTLDQFGSLQFSQSLGDVALLPNQSSRLAVSYDSWCDDVDLFSMSSLSDTPSRASVITDHVSSFCFIDNPTSTISPLLVIGGDDTPKIELFRTNEGLEDSERRVGGISDHVPNDPILYSAGNSLVAIGSSTSTSDDDDQFIIVHYSIEDSLSLKEISRITSPKPYITAAIDQNLITSTPTGLIEIRDLTTQNLSVIASFNARFWRRSDDDGETDEREIEPVVNCIYASNGFIMVGMDREDRDQDYSTRGALQVWNLEQNLTSPIHIIPIPKVYDICSISDSLFAALSSDDSKDVGWRYVTLFDPMRGVICGEKSVVVGRETGSGRERVMCCLGDVSVDVDDSIVPNWEFETQTLPLSLVESRKMRFDLADVSLLTDFSVVVEEEEEEDEPAFVSVLDDFRVGLFSQTTASLLSTFPIHITASDSTSFLFDEIHVPRILDSDFVDDFSGFVAVFSSASKGMFLDLGTRMEESARQRLCTDFAPTGFDRVYDLTVDDDDVWVFGSFQNSSYYRRIPLEVESIVDYTRVVSWEDDEESGSSRIVNLFHCSSSLCVREHERSIDLFDLVANEVKETLTEIDDDEETTVALWGARDGRFVIGSGSEVTFYDKNGELISEPIQLYPQWMQRSFGLFDCESFVGEHQFVLCQDAATLVAYDLRKTSPGPLRLLDLGSSQVSVNWMFEHSTHESTVVFQAHDVSTVVFHWNLTSGKLDPVCRLSSPLVRTFPIPVGSPYELGTYVSGVISRSIRSEGTIENDDDAVGHHSSSMALKLSEESIPSVLATSYPIFSDVLTNRFDVDYQFFKSFVSLSNDKVVFWSQIYLLGISTLTGQILFRWRLPKVKSQRIRTVHRLSDQMLLVSIRVSEETGNEDDDGGEKESSAVDEEEIAEEDEVEESFLDNFWSEEIDVRLFHIPSLTLNPCQLDLDLEEEESLLELRVEESTSHLFVAFQKSELFPSPTYPDDENWTDLLTRIVEFTFNQQSSSFERQKEWAIHYPAGFAGVSSKYLILVLRPGFNSRSVGHGVVLRDHSDVEDSAENAILFSLYHSESWKTGFDVSLGAFVAPNHACWDLGWIRLMAPASRRDIPANNDFSQFVIADTVSSDRHSLIQVRSVEDVNLEISSLRGDFEEILTRSQTTEPPFPSGLVDSMARSCTDGAARSALLSFPAPTDSVMGIRCEVLSHIDPSTFPNDDHFDGSQKHWFDPDTFVEYEDDVDTVLSNLEFAIGQSIVDPWSSPLVECREAISLVSVKSMLSQDDATVWSLLRGRWIVVLTQWEGILLPLNQTRRLLPFFDAATLEAFGGAVGRKTREEDDWITELPSDEALRMHVELLSRLTLRKSYSRAIMEDLVTNRLLDEFESSMMSPEVRIDQLKRSLDELAIRQLMPCENWCRSQYLDYDLWSIVSSNHHASRLPPRLKLRAHSVWLRSISSDLFNVHFCVSRLNQGNKLNNAQIMLGMAGRLLRLRGASFGLVHVFPVISGVPIHWFSDSRVHFETEVGTSVVVELDVGNMVPEKLLNVAKFISYCEETVVYSVRGGTDEAASHNCQTFSLKVLRLALGGLEAFPSVVKNYLTNTLPTCVTQNRSPLQLDVRGISVGGLSFNTLFPEAVKDSNRRLAAIIRSDEEIKQIRVLFRNKTKTLLFPSARSVRVFQRKVLERFPGFPEQWVGEWRLLESFGAGDEGAWEGNSGLARKRIKKKNLVVRMVRESYLREDWSRL